MEVSPCKGCTERHENCHTSCEDYLRWKEELKKLKQKEQEYRLLNYINYDRRNKKRK